MTESWIEHVNLFKHATVLRTCGPHARRANALEYRNTKLTINAIVQNRTSFKNLVHDKN